MRRRRGTSKDFFSALSVGSISVVEKGRGHTGRPNLRWSAEADALVLRVLRVLRCFDKISDQDHIPGQS